MSNNLKKENSFFKKIVFFFKKVNSISYLLWFFVFLFLVSLFLWIFSFFHVNEIDLEICGDGTFYQKCSLNKPYYCLDGKLIEDAYHCGCPKNMIKNDEKCEYENFTKNETINLKYFLNGEEFFLEFDTHSKFSEYLDSLPRGIEYNYGETPSRADFKKLKLSDEFQREILLPLVVKIWNLAPNSTVDQARIAISLVQSIEYADNPIKNIGGSLFNVSNYPYQVLEEKKGSCESKSDLLAHLLSELGYGVSVLYYNSENHESVGIKCPIEESLNKTGYCFIETTDLFPIGFSKGSYSNTFGLRLYSSPEIIIISSGFSLPNDLIEYSDTKKLEKTLEEKAGFFGLFNKCVFNNLKEKYNFSYTI